MKRPPSSLWCEVLDRRTGAQHRLVVPNEPGSWPHRIGSGADDSLRLPAGSAPAGAIELQPSGRHLQVTALLPALVRVRGELLDRGAARRVDGPFELGDLHITVRHGSDQDGGDQDGGDHGDDEVD